MTTFTVYRELQSALSVDLCLHGRFTAPDASNLLLFRGQVLEIYDVVERQGPKLALRERHRLFGCVSSAQLLQLPGSGRDALVLGFPDAKLSVVEYDPAQARLSTVWIESFDDQREAAAPRIEGEFRPMVRVDPQSRCAAMVYFDSHLVVFPVGRRRERAELRGPSDAADKLTAQQLMSPFLEPMIIPLRALGVNHIREFVFLDGYFEPTIVILHQPNLTWTGRYAVRKDACVVSAISFSLSSRQHSVFGAVPGVPHHAFGLIPVPPPLLGVMILTNNAILHFNNRTIDYGLSLNEFGDNEHRRQSHVAQSQAVATLNGAVCAFLDPSRLLLSAGRGDVYLLKIMSLGQTIRGMELVKAGVSGPAICACSVLPRVVFVGCSSGDSHLLSIVDAPRQPKRKNPEPDPEAPAATSEADDNDGDPSRKRIKTESGTPVPAAADSTPAPSDAAQTPRESEPAAETKTAAPEQSVGSAPESTAPASASAAPADSSAAPGPVTSEVDDADSVDSPFAIVVLDSIIGAGPLADFSSGDDDGDSPSESKDKDSKKQADVANRPSHRRLQLVCCSGHGRQGTLVVLQQGIVPQLMMSLASDRSDLRRGLPGAWPLRSQDSGEYDDYLLLSAGKGSELYRVSDGLEPVLNAEIFTQGPTLGVAPVCGRRAYVQVHGEGLRLLDGPKLLGAQPVAGGLVAACSVADDRVLLLLASGELRLVFLRLFAAGAAPEFQDSLFRLDETRKQGKVVSACLYRQDRSCPFFQPRLTAAQRLGRGQAASGVGATLASAGGWGAQASGVNAPGAMGTAQAAEAEDDLAAQLFAGSTQATDAAGRPTGSSASVAGSAPAPADGEQRRRKRRKKADVKEEPVQPAQAAAAPAADDLEALLFGGADSDSQAASGTGAGASAAGSTDAGAEENSEDEGGDEDEDDEKSGEEENGAHAGNLESGAKDASMETFVVVSRESGALEVYSVDGALLFHHPALPLGLPVLVDSRDAAPEHETLEQLSLEDSTSLAVAELCVAQVGPAGSPPYLFAFLQNDDLLVYRAFTYVDDTAPQRSALRFVRQPHALMTRPYGVATLAAAEAAAAQLASSGQATLAAAASNASAAAAAAAAAREAEADAGAPSVGDDEEERARRRRRRLRRPQWHGGQRLVPFEDVGGRRGVFIGGFCSAIALGEREYVRIHELVTDSSADPTIGMVLTLRDRRNRTGTTARSRYASPSGVTAIAPFHHSSCPQGFFFYDLNGKLNLCQLPPGASFDADMVVTRVPLGLTPRFVVRHEAINIYAVAAFKEVAVPHKDEFTERTPEVREKKFEVLLFDPRTWEIRGRYDDFKEHEWVLSLRYVRLGQKPFIAIGTSNQQGEDVLCKGRVILLEANWATGVTEAGEARLVKTRFYAQQQKAAVTAICTVADFICLCVGPRVLLYEWTDEPDANGSFGQLVGRAFFDSHFYIVSCESLRNFLILGDVAKSVYLLLWEPHTKQLEMLAQDHSRISVAAVNVLLHGPAMNIVVTDFNRNMQLFQYLPHKPETLFHKSLSARADFHVGVSLHRLAHLRSTPLLSPSDAVSPDEGRDRDPRELPRPTLSTMLLCGGADARVACLSPVGTRVFTRLNSLAKAFVYSHPQNAALNPLAFRLYASQSPHKHPVWRKNVLDGDLLFEFLSLSVPLQRQLSEMIGTSRHQLIDNLAEVALSTTL